MGNALCFFAICSLQYVHRSRVSIRAASTVPMVLCGARPHNFSALIAAGPQADAAGPAGSGGPGLRE